jgi:ferredoxin
MPNLNPEIRAVVDNDLCIACGACVSACPRSNLVPAFNDYRGANEVGFVAGADCTGCDAPCVPVCPSVAIDFATIGDPPRPAPARDG